VKKEKKNCFADMEINPVMPGREEGDPEVSEGLPEDIADGRRETPKRNGDY